MQAVEVDGTSEHAWIESGREVEEIIERKRLRVESESIVERRKVTGQWGHGRLRRRGCK